MNETEKIITYYTSIYNENDRLKRHRTEFITTTYILDKVIRPGVKILDLGAATGVYSFYYAGRGHPVTAIDLVPHHIREFQSKLKVQPQLQLTAEVGDARDLSCFRDKLFDAVLCLGPVCHLEGEQAHRCIRECLRVLQDNGIFASSYINRYQGYENDKYREHFIFRTPQQVKALFNQHNITAICNVPVDGSTFEKLDDYTAAHTWLAEHEAVFDKHPGKFIHGLYVGRKKQPDEF